jgi:hypothetical protein
MGETPHRMGAALSYARRYALFALVGIAGEDDLDAPDLLVEPSPASNVPSNAQTNRKNGRREPKPVLNREASAPLRDQLIAEINNLYEADQLALWAHRRLPAKNSLTGEDAAVVEAAYLASLNAASRNMIEEDLEPKSNQRPPSEQGEARSAGSLNVDEQRPSDPQGTPIRKTIRQRSKAHLRFVASQPCLVCQRFPCDAHHLKFAQPRALGMKVSDEFTVPLCREHHRQLHRHGNEMAWWANVQIAPLEIAKRLWEGMLPVDGSTLSLRTTSAGSPRW